MSDNESDSQSASGSMVEENTTPKRSPIRPGEKIKSVKKKSSKSKKDIKFNTYIHRVLKQVHEDVGITKQGMAVMNDTLVSAYHSILEEACRLVKMRNRETLTSCDIQSAVKLCLPGELANHSVNEGTRALANYGSST